MKKIFLILSTVLFLSCEEIVTPELKIAQPRLVIDAAINWEKGTRGNLQVIKLSKTTGYYQSEVPMVSGATVIVTNSANKVFNFQESNSVDLAGKYFCNDFEPVIGETYQLSITYNGETYTSVEKLTGTPSLNDDVEQINGIGIDNNQIAVKINFNDFENQEDYYLLKVESATNAFPEFEVQDDSFSQGNLLYFGYTNEKLKKDTQINFKLFGVSRRYHDFMKILIGNANGGANGPFQVPPTKVRGNIRNSTNEQNYPIGYFSLSESSKLTYITK